MGNKKEVDFFVLLDYSSIEMNHLHILDMLEMIEKIMREIVGNDWRELEKWLKSNNIESTTPKAPKKYSRAKYKKAQPKPKAISNLDIVDPIASSPKAKSEVEVEVTSKSLQLQVPKEVPKFRRLTHSSTKKETPSKGKRTIAVDLDTTEKNTSLE